MRPRTLPAALPRALRRASPLPAPLHALLLAQLLALAVLGTLAPRVPAQPAPPLDEPTLAAPAQDASPPAPAPAGDQPAADRAAPDLAAADLAAAVAAYREGRYAEAGQAFAALAASEGDPARAGVLHCNAGTAAARAEAFGEALWHLRRARMLLPRDPRTATNLERVQALLATARGTQAPAAASDSPDFARTLLDLPLHATLRETGTACSLVAAAALLALALWRLGRLPRAVVGVALAALLASAAWWAFARTTWEREGRRAVVIAGSVNGRAEPDAGSETLFHLTAGTVLDSEEQRGAWRLVESASGARGWVPADQVRPLD